MSVSLPLKRKRGLGKIFAGGRWIVIAGLVVLVGLGVALTRDFVRKAKIQKEITNLEQEINTLERNNEELSGLIAYFSSDVFMEREARSKLNVQRPGERVIEIEPIEPTTATTTESEPPVVQKEPHNNIERWWLYFFGER